MSRPTQRPFRIDRTRVQPAGALLRALWATRSLGQPARCPSCAEASARAASLSVSVHQGPHAYRLHCVVCAWRSAWFEALADGRIVLVHLDVD